MPDLRNCRSVHWVCLRSRWNTSEEPASRMARASLCIGVYRTEQGTGAGWDTPLVSIPRIEWREIRHTGHGGPDARVRRIGVFDEGVD